MNKRLSMKAIFVIKLLRSVFEKESIEGVLHFAANSLVGESVEKPLMYFNNNVHGTQIALEVMQEFGETHCFSSTAATYGEPKAMPIRRNPNES